MASFGKTFFGYFENDNDCLIPELWAAESLAILEENMLYGNLVHRDFSPDFAEFGDVVNTRKPNSFTAVRKNDAEEITIQDAGSTNIQVKLNQHWHTSFIIKDGERSKAFKDLVLFYLDPALLSIAQAIDKTLAGRFAQFAFTHRTGKLGTSATHSTILDARNVMNKNKVQQGSGRHLILTPDTETALLQLDKYSDADKLGDAGTALREASLGRKGGFNLFMAQNQPSVVTGTTAVSTTTTAAAAAGATVVNVTAATSFAVGQFLTVAGDMTPQIITAINTLAISVYPGLKYAVASGAAVTCYRANAVNQASTATTAGGDGSTAGYREGWHGSIAYDGGMGTPEVGTIITFGTGATTPTLAAALAKYTVVSATSTSIVLDRPLEEAIADNATINMGPIGNFNFGFHRNAVAFVTRPLALPIGGTGVRAAVASDRGLSIRVTIGYNQIRQGHIVTVDMLSGISTLESAAGVAVFA
jgi:hypothetical protein